MPTWYIEKIDEKEKFKVSFYNYLMVGSIITLSCCIPSILLMKSKPKIPPSVSKQNQNLFQMDVKESLVKLFKNKSFICLLISFICINSFFQFYPVVIVDIFSLYDLEITTTSYLLITALLGGVVGNFFYSWIVDHLRKYRIIFIVLSLVNLITFTLLALLLELLGIQKGNYKVLYFIGCGIYGSCIIPLFSIAYDFAHELTYPIGESVSSGMMLSFSTVLAIISTYLIDFFIKNYKDYRYLSKIYVITLFIIATVSLILLKGI